MEEEPIPALPEEPIRRTGHSAPDILSSNDNPTHLLQLQEEDPSLQREILPHPSIQEEGEAPP